MGSSRGQVSRLEAARDRAQDEVTTLHDQVSWGVGSDTHITPFFYYRILFFFLFSFIHHLFFFFSLFFI